MSVIILAAVTALAAQIEMRAADAPPPGDVLMVSLEGVTVGFPAAAPGSVGPVVSPTVVGWDRVRTVLPPNDRAAQPFLQIAEKAWRARVRMERNDLAGAEPLLEELHATFSGVSGPTAAMVGENLLRCRLSRGAQTLAIAPWLTWLGSGVLEVPAAPPRRSPKDDSPDMLVSTSSPTAIDAATGLVPALAPVWLDGAGVQAFAKSKPPLPARQGTEAAALQRKAAALSNLYWQAARFECGLDPGPIEAASDDAGLSLVQQIVIARLGGPAEREQARGQLRTRLKSRPEPWIEAWCRAGVGRSLLREDSVELKRLGIIELLHVPARLPEESPYLTGVALAEAAVALNKLGDRDGADKLRAGLKASFSGHPALDWTPISSWPYPARPAGQAPAPGPS